MLNNEIKSGISQNNCSNLLICILCSKCIRYTIIGAFEAALNSRKFSNNVYYITKSFDLYLIRRMGNQSKWNQNNYIVL